MIPAQHVKVLLLRRALGATHISGSDGKAVVRRVFPLILQWEEREHIADFTVIAAQQRAAGFIRVALGAVRADALGELGIYSKWQLQIRGRLPKIFRSDTSRLNRPAR